MNKIFTKRNADINFPQRTLSPEHLVLRRVDIYWSYDFVHSIDCIRRDWRDTSCPYKCLSTGRLEVLANRTRLECPRFAH